MLLQKSAAIVAVLACSLPTNALSFLLATNIETKPTTVTMKASSESSTTQQQNVPALELPEPIRSETPGTWAYDTMSRRVDAEILERTYQDNKDQFEKWPKVLAEFQQLRKDLQNAAHTQIGYPHPPATPKQALECEQWNNILRPFVEASDTWLSTPWMVSEFFLYRRLMDCLGYWDPDSPGYQYDPFDQQKRAGLVSSTASAESVLAKIPQLPPNDDGLQVALSIPLWGNKMDLSLWPADASSNTDVFAGILDKAHENLLHDDSQLVASYCAKLRNENGGGMVDIIVDNAGFELVTDLAAAQYLVEAGIAKTVTFQLKSHPTFVSDALEKDLLETVEYYCNLNEDQYPAAKAAGQKWNEYLSTGQWKCVENAFWVQGLPMWKMHQPLYDDLNSRCDLAIVKGDANYRRLLGDLQWDLAAPFADVVGTYFPCPVCALRTLKAELGCGMEPEQTKRAADTDDQWMVNGRFGVVQFSE